MYIAGARLTSEPWKVQNLRHIWSIAIMDLSGVQIATLEMVKVRFL